MARSLSCILFLALAACGLGCMLVGPPGPVAVMPAPELHPAPPPHAPAWGARRKHREREDVSDVALRFDPVLGVSVVVGRPGVYFDHGVYLRFSSGLWEASLRLDGPWHRREERTVPPGLRAHYRSDPPGHGRGRGHERGREERGAAHPGWDD